MNPKEQSEVGKVWDEVIRRSQSRESAAKRESTRTCRTTTSRLDLVDLDHHFMGRKRSYLLKKNRHSDEVPAILLDAFRKLCSEAMPWPLFIWGAPGTGKTCAALWLLDRAGGMYFTAGGLNADLISAYKGTLETPREHRSISASGLWQEISNTDLVVLDELGARSVVSEHQYDAVKRVLDEREGRPLICISNLPVESLEAIYDDRVASRLVAGTLVHLDGPDRRLRQA